MMHGRGTSLRQKCRLCQSCAITRLWFRKAMQDSAVVALVDLLWEKDSSGLETFIMILYCCCCCSSFFYLSLVCRQLECRMSRLCTLEDIPLVLEPHDCGRFIHIHNKDRLPDSSHSTNVPVMFNQAGLHLVASQWRNMIHSKKKKKRRKWAQFKSAAMKKSAYCDLLSRVNVCIYILSVMLILQMLCLPKSSWSILICFWPSRLSCLQTGTAVTWGFKLPMHDILKVQ